MLSLIQFLLLVSVTAKLVHSAPVTIDPPAGRDPGPQCDPGEDTCSQCYDLLANELIISDRNRVNMQKGFFPPNTSYPVFVEVRYHFIRNPDGPTNYSANGTTKTWFWTQSTFYLFQPLESLSFTSLFFSDFTFNVNSLDLYLQPNCSEADNEMLRLLTQRLKSYAVHQSIAATVTDEYSAKGENLDTLLEFHKNVPDLSPYTVSFQVVYPLLVAGFVVFLLYHVLDNNKLRYLYYTLEQDDETLKENANKESIHLLEKIKISSENLSVYTVIVCSFMFVVYVIMLDSFAVNRRIILNREIFHSVYGFNYDSKSGNHQQPLVIGQSIVFVILTQDLLVLIAMIVASIIRFCCDCFGKCQECIFCYVKWHHILIGPCCCIANHSYHILIGFIHTPHHATSILVLYGVVVLVYVVTVKVVYYNMFKCFEKCNNESDWQDCCQCFFITDKQMDLKRNSRHVCLFIVLCLVPIILTFLFAYMCFQFVLVPINNAIDDAPDRFLSINQTVIIIFGAAITFKLYQNRKDKTFFDYLVEAGDKQVKENKSSTEIFKEVWNKMSHKDKQKEMASVVLQTFFKTSTVEWKSQTPDS